MAVPNIFGTATAAIPLSQLDTNFATAITLGNTAVYLGNTTTSLGNVTLTNVTISSGNVSISTATVGAGSNTAPSITTTGDTNTGIFFPAADTIAFTEGGVESMRIDSAGNVGIGVTPSAGQSLVVGKDITGAVGSYAVHVNGTIQSGVTSVAYGVRTNLSTVASAFTLANLRHHDATQATFGAGSTVTNQSGFYVDNSLTGATSNYGFFGNIASGTNRWNFYANGTADNYMAGNLGVGTNTPTTKVQITRTALSGFLSRTSATLTLEDTAGTELYFANNTAGYGQLRFGDTDSNFRGAFTYDHSVDAMYFVTAATERMRIDTAGNAQFLTGAVMPYAPAPAAISAAATLTNANIQAQIISATGTTYTITMPLGTTLETLATWATTGIAYDFYIINAASGTITLDATEVGVTSVGTMTIATGVSAQFRIRRTAANTFVVYRLG
jgi:hypothetical protein